jgi:(p)ppGpp synthase/HD superfamily hydrolase
MMPYTNNIQRAINISAKKLFGQERKALHLPYIVHPFSVAIILSEYTKDEDIMIAGLLHDILEAAPDYSIEQIEKDFNARIRNIIDTISIDLNIVIKDNEKATWEKRKLELLERLKTSANDAKMVCCADKIHNLQSLILEYKQVGEKIWTRIGIPKQAVLSSYNEILQCLKSVWQHPILIDFEQQYLLAKQKLS